MARQISIVHDGEGPPTRGLNPIRKRMEQAKREALEAELGKGESWAAKVINNQCGVTLDDLPAFLEALGLKVVDRAKTCIDPELAHAYETIVRRLTRERCLLAEDSE